MEPAKRNGDGCQRTADVRDVLKVARRRVGESRFEVVVWFG